MIKKHNIINLTTGEISDNIYIDMFNNLEPINADSGTNQYFFKESDISFESPYNFYTIYDTQGKVVFTDLGDKIKLLGNNLIEIIYEKVNSNCFVIVDTKTIDLNTGNAEEKREFGYCTEDLQKETSTYNAFQKYMERNKDND